MQELFELIKEAVAESATAEVKAAGAQACRTILTALEAEPGKPMALPGVSASTPAGGIDISQVYWFGVNGTGGVAGYGEREGGSDDERDAVAHRRRGAGRTRDGAPAGGPSKGPADPPPP